MSTVDVLKMFTDGDDNAEMSNLSAKTKSNIINPGNYCTLITSIEYQATCIAMYSMLLAFYFRILFVKEEISNSIRILLKTEFLLAPMDRRQSVSQNDIHNSLAKFDDLDSIQDPDIKFALQLQREELELEQTRKKQYDEDQAFALELHQNRG